MGIVFLFCQALHAQSDEVEKRQPVKFADFGKISAVELKKTVDSFCAASKKDEGSQGYIIGYGSPAALKKRRNEIFLSSWCFRTYDPPRITWVDGPAQPKIRTMFWIVPAGATPPVP